MHVIGLIAMAIDHIALQHIEHFKSAMLEGGKYVGLGGERNHIGLNHDSPVGAVAQQLILMASACAPPLNGEALPSLDERGIPDFLKAAKQGSNRHLQGLAQGLQGTE